MIHAKLTLVYLKNNATVSYSPFNMCILARKVCVCYGLWNPPTASLPNCISARRVANWRKTQRISFHSSSCALVSVGVVNRAKCVCIKSEEEGLVKKTLSNILNLDCNTYSILHTAPLISHWNYNSTKNKSAVNQSKLSFPQISSPLSIFNFSQKISIFCLVGFIKWIVSLNVDN